MNQTENWKVEMILFYFFLKAIFFLFFDKKFQKILVYK